MYRMRRSAKKHGCLTLKCPVAQTENTQPPQGGSAIMATTGQNGGGVDDIAAGRLLHEHRDAVPSTPASSHDESAIACDKSIAWNTVDRCDEPHPGPSPPISQGFGCEAIRARFTYCAGLLDGTRAFDRSTRPMRSLKSGAEDLRARQGSTRDRWERYLTLSRAIRSPDTSALDIGRPRHRPETSRRRD